MAFSVLRFAAALLVVLAAGTSAQISGGTISTGCQTALQSIISGEFGSCTGMNGYLAMTNSTFASVQPMDDWLHTFCPSKDCSSSAVSSANQTLFVSCPNELYQGLDGPVAVAGLVMLYPMYRKMFCLQDTKNNNEYCMPSAIVAAEKATGQSDNATDIFGLDTSKWPTSVLCTDCMHAIATVIMTDSLLANATDAAAPGVQQCGSSFTDKQIPSTIKLGAGQPAGSSVSSSSASSSSSSSSASSSSSGHNGAAMASQLNFATIAGSTGVLAGALALVF